MGIYSELTARAEQDSIKAWNDTQDQWQKDLEKQVGGKPALDANLSKLGGIINAYVEDSTAKFKANNPNGVVPDYGKVVKDAMTMTGAGNNPATMSFFFWIADQLGEGRPLGGSPAGGEQSRASVLFGSTMKK